MVWPEIVPLVTVTPEPTVTLPLTTPWAPRSTVGPYRLPTVMLDRAVAVLYWVKGGTPGVVLLTKLSASGCPFQLMVFLAIRPLGMTPLLLRMILIHLSIGGPSIGVMVALVTIIGTVPEPS